MSTTLTNSSGGGGGGGSATALEQFSVDAVPGSPAAIDDEFSDSSIDAKWTQLNSGTAATWTERSDGRLYLSAAAATGPATKGIMQTMPTGDWTVATKVSSYLLGRANYCKPAGLILAEGTTGGDLIWTGITHNATLLGAVWYGTTWGAFSANLAGVAAYHSETHYLRITKATSTYTFEMSNDGQTWLQLYSSTIAFTPTIIGLGGIVENTTYPIAASFDWFRQTA